MTPKKSLLVLISITLIAALTWILSKPQLGVAPNLGFTWGNALQVAYPEYQILHRGDADTEREIFRATTIVEVESHANAVTSREQRHILEISQNIFGDVTFPSIEKTVMTPYLLNFKGGTPALPGEKEKAIVQAQLLPRDQRFIVLVELTHPMLESDLPVRFDYGEWQRFFLSGAQPKSTKPIYWWPGWGGCTAMASRAQNCGTRIVVDDYRKWVSQFTEDDSQNLSEIGLDLGKLRATATEGKVYGFIDTVTGRDRLLELLGKPQVRAAHVIAKVPDIDG